MSWRENRREKKLIKDAKKQGLNVVPGSSPDEKVRRAVEKFSSWREILKNSIPQLLISILLLYVEYEIIGLIYTLISVAVYAPLIFFYSKSLIEKRGRYLLVVSIDKGSTEITRYLIPDELWDLIEFDHPLVPGMIRFNGRDTFLGTKVWTLDGTNQIYKVKLSWFHFNQLEYLRNRGILERAIAFATQLSLENAELEKLKEFLAVVEGKRQTKERLDLIDKAYREDPVELKKRILKVQSRIDDLAQSNRDLLAGYEESEEKEEREKEVENDIQN